MFWFPILGYLFIAILVTFWAKEQQLPFRPYSSIEDWLDAMLVGLLWPLYLVYFLVLRVILLARILFGIDPDDKA